MAFAYSAFVWVVLASSAANAFRSKMTLKTLTEDALDVNASSAKLDFPKVYTKIMEPVQFLGAGSFGEAWLVRDLQPKSPRAGKLIVMKLLYIKDDRTKRNKHLTWAMAANNKLLRKEVISAAKECEISKMMQEEAEKSDHPGAMRIMNCYGHNAPVLPSGAIKRVEGTAAKRPLYLLLENCGATDLTKFMKEKAAARQVDLALVQNLYKQLMEGLSFLRQLPNPWVHHDLKPDNIVVKTQKDGTYSLHLIDFGASTETTASKRSKMTPSTSIFAPNEWGIDGNFGWCPGSHSSKPDGNCGTAFDIFSAGAIFVEILTGEYMAYLPGFLNRNDMNYNEIERYTENTRKFASGLSSLAKSAYKTTTSEFSKTWAGDFLPVVASQLTKLPRKRPTADQIMDSDFLYGVQTPDDIDYMAMKKQHIDDEVAAAAGIDAVEVDRKYQLNDKVFVFSNTAERDFGNGWCVGRVKELIPGDKVLVEFSLSPDDGTVFTKELEDWSEWLRPYVDNVNVEDEEDNAIEGDNEFKPSSGGKAGGLLNGEAEEEENSKCPSWCDECDIAMNDKGTLAGHRRTINSKWASVCYVDRLKKVRNPKEGKPENGAVCTMGPTVNVGKKIYQAYICPDLGLLHVKPEYKPDNWKQYVKVM